MAAEGQPAFHDFLGVARCVKALQSRNLVMKPLPSDLEASFAKGEGCNHMEASPAAGVNSGIQVWLSTRSIFAAYTVLGSDAVDRELKDLNHNESSKREVIKNEVKDYTVQLRRALELQGSVPFSKRSRKFVETTIANTVMSDTLRRPRLSDASCYDDHDRMTTRCVHPNCGSPGCITSIKRKNTMMLPATTINARDSPSTPTFLCPTDEGSRTGLLNGTWTAAEGVLRGNSNHTFDLLLPPFSGPSSSTPTKSRAISKSLPQTGALSDMVRGKTRWISRQLTIFYGGQAHVFEDVPFDKLEEIMALAAGSSGRSWSTTYHSQLKSNGTGSFAATSMIDATDRLDAV